MVSVQNQGASSTWTPDFFTSDQAVAENKSLPQSWADLGDGNPQLQGAEGQSSLPVNSPLSRERTKGGLSSVPNISFQTHRSN